MTKGSWHNTASQLLLPGGPRPRFPQCARIRGARGPFQYQHRFQHTPLVGRVRGPGETIVIELSSTKGQLAWAYAVWGNQFDKQQ